MVAVVLAYAVPASAQRWGRPRPPRAGACFYQNANYGGDYFCVEAGDEYDVMPEGLNDRISSIRRVIRVPPSVGRSRTRTRLASIAAEFLRGVMSSRNPSPEPGPHPTQRLPEACVAGAGRSSVS